MDKIAVLSDIHGNLEALKACLKDIDEKSIKHIICLGDIIAKGVHPNECIDLLKQRNTILIRGNCDRYFSEIYTKDQMNDRIAFNQNMIDEETRHFLYHLPMCYECYVSGVYIRFVHATSWADDVFVGSASSMEDEWKMFQPTQFTSDKIADVLIYGHTHVPYLNKAYHHTLINTGSVGNCVELFQDDEHPGNSKLTTMAYYLVIEGNINSETIAPISFNHIQVPYDIEKELDNDLPNSEKEQYANELRYGKYRDLAKLKLLRK